MKRHRSRVYEVCVNERFNRTFNEQIFKYFFANNTRKFVDVHDLLVDQYNDTIHSSINMIPKEASRKENENKVRIHLYPELGDKTLAPKCSSGDNVRITLKKNHLIRDKLKDGRKMFLQFSKFD